MIWGLMKLPGVFSGDRHVKRHRGRW